jgi:hypothetical protein
VGTCVGGSGVGGIGVAVGGNVEVGVGESTGVTGVGESIGESVGDEMGVSLAIGVGVGECVLSGETRAVDFFGSLVGVGSDVDFTASVDCAVGSSGNGVLSAGG